MPTIEEQQAELLEQALADMRDPRRRGLDVSRFLFGVPHVAAIAEALPKSNLRHLALGREQLDDAALAPLIDTLPDCPKLQTLQLHTGGRIRETSLKKLTEVLPRSSLVTLALDAYFPTDSQAMCDLIEAASRSSLREFEVCGQEFGDKEVDALIPLIQSGQLTKVKLNRGRISTEGAEKLFTALKGSAVTHFEFRALNMNNSLNAESMQALADTLQQGRLTALKLPHSRLKTEDARILAQGMKGSNLTELVLSDNRSIGAEGLEAIAEALPHTSVRVLGIDRCSNQGKGYETLFAALPDTEVETLQLYGTHLQYTQAAKLAEVLPHTKLRSLHLAANAIGTAGMKELVRAVPASRLVYLDIGSSGSLSAVGEDLKTLLPMSGLGYLDIREEGVTTAAMQHIREGVEAGNLARVECYGSNNDAAKQEAANACYKAAGQNQRAAYKLAYKLATLPQEMTAEEWEAAADSLGAIRFCIDQNWKTDDFIPIRGEDTDKLLQQSFTQAAQHGHSQAATRALMCLLPYDEAITTLDALGIPCKAADLLAEDGTLPPRQLCHGGVPRLFADAARWDSPEQYSTAYKSLPDALKAQAETYHTTRYEIAGRTMAQERGR